MSGKNKLNILLLAMCSIAISITACKTTSKVSSETAIKSTTLKPEDYLAHKIEYTSFSGKADMNIIKADLNQNFSAHIRMDKDKTIWTSVMVLGIAEVARALITPDSLNALVRIGKKAYCLSYEEGQQLIQAPIEFPVLQNLIIGNPLIENAQITKVDSTDSLFIIHQEKNGLTQTLTYQRQTRILKTIKLNSPANDFNCNIDFSNYKPLAFKQLFAFSRIVHIHNGGRDILLNMDFSKAEVNIPILIPFSIPSSYNISSIKIEKY